MKGSWQLGGLMKGSHERQSKQGDRMLRIGVGVRDVVDLGRHYVLRVTLVIDSPKTDQFCGRLIN